MATNTTVPLEKVWGLRVRERRQDLRLTQRQLAGLVEPPTTQGTIHKIETGEITPRDSLKRGLARALSCPPEVLFPWDTQLGAES